MVEPVVHATLAHQSIINMGTKENRQPAIFIKKLTPGYGVAAWALWIYIIISVGRLGELIPGMGSLPLAKIAIGISIIATLLSEKKPTTLKPPRSALVRTSIALFAISLLLIPFSILKSESVLYFINVGIPVAIGFYLVRKLCSNWRNIRMTIFVLTTSSVILAIAAMISGNSRISAGSSYDTNDLAYVLSTCLPLSLAFAYLARPRQAFVFYGIAALMLVAVLLTQSRGGLLGIVAATLFLILRPLDGKRRSISKAAFVVAIVTIAGVAIFSALPNETRDRLSTLGNLGSDYNLESDNVTGRTSIWRRGLSAAIERPIGYGVATFQRVDLLHGGKYKAPHNSLLQVAVELGLLGLFLYFLALTQAWRTLSAMIRNALAAKPDNEDSNKLKEFRVFSIALKAALVANFVAGFFLSQAFSVLYWTLLAVISCVNFKSASGDSIHEVKT